MFLHAFLRCMYDYLEVRDGSITNADLISRLCGNTRPSTQHSTGSSMLLRFRTDTSVTHKGFKAKYSKGKDINVISHCSYFESIIYIIIIILCLNYIHMFLYFYIFVLYSLLLLLFTLKYFLYILGAGPLYGGRHVFYSSPNWTNLTPFEF